MAQDAGQANDLRVIRLKDRPDKFVVILSNLESPHLSLNDGELAEQELRILLVDKYRKSPSEIDTLINEAKRNYERES